MAAQQRLSLVDTVFTQRRPSFAQARIIHREPDIGSESPVCCIGVLHCSQCVCQRQPRVTEIGFDGDRTTHRLHCGLVVARFPISETQLEMRHRCVMALLAQGPEDLDRSICIACQPPRDPLKQQRHRMTRNIYQQLGCLYIGRTRVRTQQTFDIG